MLYIVTMSTRQGGLPSFSYGKVTCFLVFNSRRSSDCDKYDGLSAQQQCRSRQAIKE